MPTLDWIGKKAVLNHHREVPFRLLKCDKSLSVGEADSGNLLVQGDNLLALKALLPYYAGKVKCIEMDENICQSVTTQRLRKVIEGYTIEKNDKKEQVPGLDGGFRFCKLGEPLFDETGNIRESVSFSDLAAHIYFAETGNPLPKRVKADSPLLGAHEGIS